MVLIHGLGGSSDWWKRNIDIDAISERHMAVSLDFVTHDTALAKRASRIVEIRDGRITADHAPS